MGVYCVGWSASGDYGVITASEEHVYMGARLVGKRIYSQNWSSGTVSEFTADRLQSKGNGSNYYPYGESKTGAAGDDREGFATYTRDGGTGLDYADQRWYASGLGRFLTSDPASLAAVRFGKPSSWNSYTYVTGDPIGSFDPFGLCPKGMVEADDKQMAAIATTARTYTGVGVTYSDGKHFGTNDDGGLSIDCSGLVSQALAGLSYVNGSPLVQATTTFTTRQTSTLFAADSTYRVGDIIWFPGHVGIVSEVDAKGNVTKFIGSQSKGPAEVDLTKNLYWSKRISEAKAYKPCVPETKVATAGSGSAQDPPVDNFIVNGGVSISSFSWAQSPQENSATTSTISYNLGGGSDWMWIIWDMWM